MTELRRLFSAAKIHSLKPASLAASHDLSTAVETRVEMPKSPAQRGLLVVWTDAPGPLSRPETVGIIAAFPSLAEEQRPAWSGQYN